MARALDTPLRTALTLPVALAGLWTLGACTKEEPAPPPAPPAPPPAAAPAAAPVAPAAGATGSGVIKGTATLGGRAPAMEVPKTRAADAFCKKFSRKDEEVVVGKGGGLRNVLVRVTRGATGTYPAPADKVAIEQHECMYTPRVQGAIVGQTIQIKNGDQALHNVHTYVGPAGDKTWFNQAQIQGTPPLDKTYREKGMIKFKCDVHPFMTGYVGLNDNPFFAVSGDDGAFTIEKLPPGSYTVEAWHEKYGTQNTEVTVAADKPGEAKFEFKAVN